MGNCIFVGALAAFGLLSLLWLVLGWLLPGGSGCALVCYGAPDTGIVSRYRWLYGMGLLRCPLLVAAGAAQEETDWEVYSAEALMTRLEWERNRSDGTGTGDPTGHHRSGGVPEL